MIICPRCRSPLGAVNRCPHCACDLSSVVLHLNLNRSVPDAPESEVLVVENLILDMQDYLEGGLEADGMELHLRCFTREFFDFARSLQEQLEETLRLESTCCQNLSHHGRLRDHIRFGVETFESGLTWLHQVLRGQATDPEPGYCDLRLAGDHLAEAAHILGQREQELKSRLPQAWQAAA